MAVGTGAPKGCCCAGTVVPKDPNPPALPLPNGLMGGAAPLFAPPNALLGAAENGVVVPKELAVGAADTGALPNALCAAEAPPKTLEVGTAAGALPNKPPLGTAVLDPNAFEG